MRNEANNLQREATRAMRPQAREIVAELGIRNASPAMIDRVAKELARTYLSGWTRGAERERAKGAAS